MLQMLMVLVLQVLVLVLLVVLATVPLQLLLLLLQTWPVYLPDQDGCRCWVALAVAKLKKVERLPRAASSFL